MTSYIRDNFKIFSNYLNTEDFCYIAPVVLNKIGQINVVCKRFVITETHNIYIYIGINVQYVFIKIGR